MSYWYEPKIEDIDLTEEWDEIHAYLDSDESGARYVSLKVKDIKKILGSSHNTELIQKIEGVLSEVVIENENLTETGVVIDETVQKIRTKFRNIINQDK